MKFSNKEEVINELDYGKGFLLDSLSESDYKLIFNLVSIQYTKNLLAFHPELELDLKSKKLSQYHQFNIQDHKDIWTKERRTLEEEYIKGFKNTDLILNLKKIFGEIKITNEDSTRTEEIYWRLVRPSSPTDVGPLHADSWFWKLHYGPIDPTLRRVKIWISLFNEKGKNGFRLIPNSQKMHISFRGEMRDGKMKPVADLNLESRNDIKDIETEPGQFIIFHDDLIHGGFAGGNETRISIEFTLLIKKH